MERLTMLVNSHLLDNGKLDKEYDLNNKIQLNEYSCMDIPNAVYNKLGELEDVLEKCGIESVEKLEDYLTPKLFCYAKLSENLDELKKYCQCEPIIHIDTCEPQVELITDKIKDLEQELAELKQKSIVPKFRTYQSIFYITQYYTSTKGNPEYDIISDKYYVAENENEIILGWNYAKDFNQRKYYYVRKDWVFATKEEAEQKLAEIKGE